MKVNSRTTLRLLKPHAKPYIAALLLVVALGALTAAGQRAVYLLVKPTWDVLFSQTEAQGEDQAESRTGSSEAVDPAQAPPAGVDQAAAEGLAGGSAGFLSGENTWFARVRERTAKLVLGNTQISSDADRMALLWRVAALVSLLALFTAVVQYGFIWLGRWVSLRMIVSLRLRIARHLMGLSLRYHGQRHFGDLLSRVSSDVTTTLNVVRQSLRDLVQQPLQAVSSLAYCFFLQPRETLIVIVGMPLLAVPVAIFARKVRRGSKRSLSKLGASVQVLSQMFQGVRTVKAFRAEERELERYREINETYLRSTMRMVRSLALSSAWTTLFSHVGLGVLLLVVGTLSLSASGPQDGGRMATFFLLIAGVYANIKATTKALTRAQESVGAAGRLQDLLEQPPDIVERAEAGECRGLGQGMLLEGVSVTYPGAESSAISELSLEVQPGETLALVGPSGAGKSTLVDLMARFIDPTEGRIQVDGRDLRDLSLDSWTAQYALVGQVPFLFHTSIEENIRYGDPTASTEQVHEAARSAGIHDFIMRLPDGYATDVADAGSRLSGGQRQRITIARAFLKSAPLILLDEATSALDPESEAVIQEALERLMADRTVVVIAHRLSTIRNADRIAVLESGRLVEIGSHSELLERKGVYARMHAAQHPKAREAAPS